MSQLDNEEIKKDIIFSMDLTTTNQLSKNEGLDPTAPEFDPTSVSILHQHQTESRVESRMGMMTDRRRSVVTLEPDPLDMYTTMDMDMDININMDLHNESYQRESNVRPRGGSLALEPSTPISPRLSFNNRARAGSLGSMPPVRLPTPPVDVYNYTYLPSPSTSVTTSQSKNDLFSSRPSLSKTSSSQSSSSQPSSSHPSSSQSSSSHPQSQQSQQTNVVYKQPKLVRGSQGGGPLMEAIPADQCPPTFTIQVKKDPRRSSNISESGNSNASNNITSEIPAAVRDLGNNIPEGPAVIGGRDINLKDLGWTFVGWSGYGMSRKSLPSHHSTTTTTTTTTSTHHQHHSHRHHHYSNTTHQQHQHPYLVQQHQQQHHPYRQSPGHYYQHHQHPHHHQHAPQQEQQQEQQISNVQSKYQQQYTTLPFSQQQMQQQPQQQQQKKQPIYPINSQSLSNSYSALTHIHMQTPSPSPSHMSSTQSHGTSNFEGNLSESRSGLSEEPSNRLNPLLQKNTSIQKDDNLSNEFSSAINDQGSNTSSITNNSIDIPSSSSIPINSSVLLTFHQEQSSQFGQHQEPQTQQQQLGLPPIPASVSKKSISAQWQPSSSSSSSSSISNDIPHYNYNQSARNVWNPIDSSNYPMNFNLNYIPNTSMANSNFTSKYSFMRKDVNDTTGINIVTTSMPSNSLLNSSSSLSSDSKFVTHTSTSWNVVPPARMTPASTSTATTTTSTFPPVTTITGTSPKTSFNSNSNLPIFSSVLPSSPSIVTSQSQQQVSSMSPSDSNSTLNSHLISNSLPPPLPPSHDGHFASSSSILSTSLNPDFHTILTSTAITHSSQSISTEKSVPNATSKRDDSGIVHYFFKYPLED